MWPSASCVRSRLLRLPPADIASSIVIDLVATAAVAAVLASDGSGGDIAALFAAAEDTKNPTKRAGPRVYVYACIFVLGVR